MIFKVFTFTLAFAAALACQASLAQQAAGSATPAPSAIASLSQFLKQQHSGKADFTQTVTQPAKAGEASGKQRNSAGSFEFLRPNRFRFTYRKPYEQTLVSDGKTLWMHDVDLNQVSSRPVSQALQGTAAILLTTAADLRELQSHFELIDGVKSNSAGLPNATNESLHWLKATPKQKDSAVRLVEMGFRQTASGLSELAALRIVDGFGQTSDLRFGVFDANYKASPERFNFKAPAGTEVIKP